MNKLERIATSDNKRIEQDDAPILAYGLLEVARCLLNTLEQLEADPGVRLSYSHHYTELKKTINDSR